MLNLVKSRSAGKNLFLTFLVMIVLQFNPFGFISTKVYAQWEILNEGTKGGFNTIDFVNENVGWIAGDKGTLKNTQDGGENWNAITINEEWNISTIDFITESIGWLIGNDEDYSFIMKSIDGGNNWTIQKQIEFALNAIYAVDENNAYVGCGDGKILKTTNGGVEWSNIQLNSQYDFYSIWALNPQVVVLVGKYLEEPYKGIIVRTEDSGSSWQEIIVPEFSRITDLQFLNDSTCYFLATTNTYNYFICESMDTCKSWSVITEENNVNSYCFINHTTAYLTKHNSIMKSTDGGVNWQNIFESFDLSLGKIYFTELNFGFILSNAGLLKSTEGGNDWIIQKIIYPLNSAYFITKDRGFLVGGYSWSSRPGRGTIGYIFLTNDGGSTSIDINSTGGIVQTCLFIDEFIGFAVTREYIFTLGDFTEILKTTDGGINWNEVSYTFQWDFLGNDIGYANDGVIWSVGCGSGYARIIASTDLGESWSIINTFQEFGELYSICFTDSIGWSVGEGGSIVKYTPQDGWILSAQVTDLQLNKVFFSDKDHGWIAGGYQNYNGFQKILLKTTDGGLNWDEVANIPYLFRDIVFLNNNTGWAIGYTQNGDGGILRTVDGGMSWIVDTGNLSSKLNALFIKDGYGWAVGENGLVLRNTDAGTVWVENENKTIPVAFRLDQNYPNPFNPSTKIKYLIPQSSNVVIKVYDILGNEIETLVNEEKQIGTYEITWYAENLPSGVYFYQLRAGDFVETKKMLLIK